MARVKLQNFSGGANNWRAAHLLPEGVLADMLDAEVTSGEVTPLAGLLAVDRPARVANVTASRSLARWGNQEYWSDNDTGELGSGLGYIGIPAPTEPIEITLGNRGTRFLGVYRYLCTYETADGWESGAYLPGATEFQRYASINAAAESATLSNDYPEFNIVHKKVSKPQQRGYELGDRVSYAGQSWECIQEWTYRRVKAETFYPGVSGSKYWKNITEVTITSTGYDTINLLLPQPDNSIAVKINIYRTAKDGSEFYYLDTVNVGVSSYSDQKPDVELLFASAFVPQDIAPPVYQFGSGSWRQVGGKYLTELDGVFYLAVGSNVYLSEQNNPHSWNVLKFVTVPDTVTGMAKESRAVLVFTANRTYRLAGSTIEDLVLEDLKVNQGCPNWRTIAFMRNVPVWLSNDGLCVYGAVESIEGRQVRVVTEGRYRVPAGAVFAAAANDKYHLFYADSSIMFDFRAEGRAGRSTVTGALAYYDQDDDSLYIADADGNWFKYGAGDPLEFYILTGEASGGELNLPKRFRKVHLDADGEISLIVYIDGVEKADMVDTSTGQRRRFLPPGLRGNRIQFGVSGSGKLRAIEVEFEILDGGR
jgi:hypothetical protein